MGDVMNGFERLKQKKKMNILQAAFDLFNEKGIKQVKISDIAKKADVSQVTIYNHFTNKEELIREVIKDYTHKKFEEYSSLLESDEPFHEVIEKFILDKVEALDTLNKDLLTEVLDRDEELKVFVDHFYKHYSMPLFVSFIQKAQENGDVDPTLSLEAIMLYLDMVKKQIESLPADYFTDSRQSKFRNDIMQLFFYGVSGRKQQ
ncbi:TetR/AcrR family transcriptional regulator [Pseudalkalibacillus caeni]|uniref:TetR/AcrR family transcriptional regulator n=1 Tax=Exobacillus caeni TaxID=2574798 RepID=A0A5R9F4U5_9BACL|nr:TetR/AcrR family transcriptional regulator [Pseudalkalibacillus caeni]TLS38742.1 TetR/AcrR family transcriptional regulator [Pseudalkalibacillus caeni]